MLTQGGAAPPMDDLTLMTRLAAGDQTAMGELYDRYGKPVYALACRMLGDPTAAEDVTQEVFVKVWRHAARFDPARGQAGTWILRIAHSTAVDLLRTRRRQAPGRFEPAPEQPDDGADTAAAAEVAVLSTQVRTALMRIPADQRQAVELAYYNALTFPEISRQLNLPLGTVKSRVRLGLEALRQFLLAPLRKEGEARANLSPRR